MEHQSWATASRHGDCFGHPQMLQVGKLGHIKFGTNIQPLQDAHVALTHQTVAAKKKKTGHHHRRRQHLNFFHGTMKPLIRPDCRNRSRRASDTGQNALITLPGKFLSRAPSKLPFLVLGPILLRL